MLEDQVRKRTAELSELSSDHCSVHGIMSMRQRILGVGGEFDMHSSRTQGTAIRVLVPLGDRAARGSGGTTCEPVTRNGLNDYS
jgi:signal transduction histidine kinase